MRQMTLNNALKEENVWFRITPEQAQQVATILNNKLFADALAININKYPSGWLWEESIQDANLSEYEQIQIINEVPFKTQKEVWEFLISNDGNVVEHFCDDRKLTLVNGELFNITDQCKSHLSLREPSVWKPSSELYKPQAKAKEWWELNGNKPTLCWYDDDLEKITHKKAPIGLCSKINEVFFCSHASEYTWKYAIPLTEEDIESFLFKPLGD